MKRIFIVFTIMLLAGCAGLPTARDSSNTGTAESTPTETTSSQTRERSEVENLLLTLDHVSCNIDMFDYEEGRTKIRCK